MDQVNALHPGRGQEAGTATGLARRWRLASAIVAGAAVMLSACDGGDSPNIFALTPTQTTPATVGQTATVTPSATTTTGATLTPMPTATASPAATATRTPTPPATATTAPAFTVSGRAWERVSNDAFQACPGCVIRVDGPGGTFSGTAGDEGNFSIARVPAGTYRLYRVCGTAALPAEEPWDGSLGYAAIPVPFESRLWVNVGKCP